MKNTLRKQTHVERVHQGRRPPRQLLVPAGAALLGLGLLLGAAGCGTRPPAQSGGSAAHFAPLAPKSGEAQQVNDAVEKAIPMGDRPSPTSPASTDAAATGVLTLREGDLVSITFPGAPSLNTSQQIRRDGRVSLPLVGEFKAAGLVPHDMEKELIKLYGPQLQVKEVTVAVQSSTFPVYVTGAVLRPGKILSERPLTALEAIMEAGGFDHIKANLKKVRIVRQEDGRAVYRTLDLKRALDGKEDESFALKPFDIIYVPERFAWF